MYKITEIEELLAESKELYLKQKYYYDIALSGECDTAYYIMALCTDTLNEKKRKLREIDIEKSDEYFEWQEENKIINKHEEFFKDEYDYGECVTCEYRKRYAIIELQEPCSRCTHRINRKEDKSEWIPR